MANEFYNVDRTTYHDTLQDAHDNATALDTIELVFDGVLYDVTASLTKALTIRAGAERSPILSAAFLPASLPAWTSIGVEGIYDVYRANITYADISSNQIVCIVNGERYHTYPYNDAPSRFTGQPNIGFTYKTGGKGIFYDVDNERDPTTSYTYLAVPSGFDPNTATIEISRYRYCIEIASGAITSTGGLGLSGIGLENAGQAQIYAGVAFDGLTLQSCTIRHGNYGIYINENVSNILVSGCVIEDVMDASQWNWSWGAVKGYLLRKWMEAIALKLIKGTDIRVTDTIIRGWFDGVGISGPSHHDVTNVEIDNNLFDYNGDDSIDIAHKKGIVNIHHNIVKRAYVCVSTNPSADDGVVYIHHNFFEASLDMGDDGKGGNATPYVWKGGPNSSQTATESQHIYAYMNTMYCAGGTVLNFEVSGLKSIRHYRFIGNILYTTQGRCLQNSGVVADSNEFESNIYFRADSPTAVIIHDWNGDDSNHTTLAGARASYSGWEVRGKNEDPNFLPGTDGHIDNTSPAYKALLHTDIPSGWPDAPTETANIGYHQTEAATPPTGSIPTLYSEQYQVDVGVDNRQTFTPSATIGTITGAIFTTQWTDTLTAQRNHAVFSIGFTDGTNQAAVVSGSQNNVSNTINHRSGWDNRCLIIPNIDGTVLGYATIVSLGPNVVVEWQADPGRAAYITVIFITAPCKVMGKALPTSVGGTVDFNGLDFTPTQGWFISALLNIQNQNNIAYGRGLGMFSYDGSTIKQAAHGVLEPNNDPASNPYSTLRTDAVVVQPQTSGASLHYAEVTAVDSSAVTLTQRGNSSGGDYAYACLIGTIPSEVIHYSTETDDTQDTDITWSKGQPNHVALVQSVLDAQNTVANDITAGAVSLSLLRNDAARSHATYIAYSNDPASQTDARERAADKAVLLPVNHSVAGLEAVHSFNGNGLALNWDTVLGTPRYGFALMSITGGITPAPGAIAFSGVDPVVVLGSVTLTPVPSVIAFSGVDPTVVLGTVNVTLTPGTISFSGVDPTVVQGPINVTPTPGVISFSGVDPTIVLGAVSVTPTPDTITFSGSDPTVVLGEVSVIPALGVITFSGVNPAVPSGESVTPIPGLLVFSGVDPTVVLGAVSVTPTPGVISFSGLNPTVVVITSGTGKSGVLGTRLLKGWNYLWRRLERPYVFAIPQQTPAGTTYDAGVDAWLDGGGNVVNYEPKDLQYNILPALWGRDAAEFVESLGGLATEGDIVLVSPHQNRAFLEDVIMVVTGTLIGTKYNVVELQNAPDSDNATFVVARLQRREA